MKTPCFKSTGGGGSQLDSLHSKIAKKTFRPFISSSLALALCASLANAAGGGSTPTCTVSGNNPSICINGSTTDQSSTLGVTWIDDNGYSKFENAHGLLEFNISKSGSLSSGFQGESWYTVYVRENTDNPSFTLATSGNRGLKIGNGSGNLKIQFGDATTWNNAQAVLNLTGATNDNGSSVALFGNLVIEGGVDKPMTENNNHVHTLATFGGVLKGNVTVKDFYGRTSNNSLTFSSGKITGSVSNLGGLTIIFEQIGGIGGGVSTESAGLATIDAGQTTIILKNGGTIQGGVSTNGATTSITSTAGTTNISGGITTTQGSMTVNIVSGDISGGIAYIGGGSSTNLNTITFKDGGSIEGNITSKANGTGYINTATNNIIFEGTKDASITGDLFSNDGASDTTGNVIAFNGSGVNSITGDIYNKWSQYTDGQGRNTITFSAGTSNTITGNITADSGANKIEATKTSSTNLITGNITAKANTFAKNTITLDGSSNTINGKITANNGGSNTITLGKTSSTQNSIGQSAITTYNRGINVIELGVSSGTSSIQGDIIHSGGGVSNDNASDPTTYGRNEIIFNSDGSITGDIKAQSNGQGWAGTVKNLITFNGASDNSITGDIFSDDGGGDSYGNIITFSNTSVGNNTITGDITSKANAWGSSGNNIINFNADGATNEIAGNLIALAGRNKITFAGASSTHSITGDIQSAGGSNIISITDGTLATFTGNIDNNASSVSITSSNASTTLSISETNSIISTYGGATANTDIQSAGALTINLKSIQVTSNGNPYNTNTIIAKNAGGNKITTTEGIQTNHWKAITNLAINGDANNTTSSVLSSDIINYGSTNIILQDTTWAPKAFKAITATASSGTLTNNGGTTNLVIRTTKAISSQSQIPIYNVNANGGNANIVMQGNASAVANINYGGGNVNLLFASSSDNMADTFDSKGTKITENKVLGKIYSDGVKLSLNDISVAINDESKSLISTFGDNFRNNDGTLLKLDVARTSTKDTINISGLIAGEITSLTSGQSSKAYEVTLNPNSAFVGTLGIESNNITLTMGDNSKLVFAGGKDTAYAKIATLTLDSVDFDPTQTMNPIFDQTNTVINLATGVNDVYNAPIRKDFRLLEIGTKGGKTASTGLVGDNALFQVYVNTNAGSDASLGGKNQGEWGSTNYGSQYLADRVVVHNVGDNSTASTQHLQIVYDAGVQIDSIHYTQGGTETNGNIAVATVVNQNNASGTAGNASQEGAVKFNLQNTLQGFDEITSTLVGIYTDQYGNAVNGADYTTYFIHNARSSGASEANREATATAFGVNYDLYMANFNSLNKRMGELRDNPHTQGAWLRIFNGSQTNDMGLGTKSNYTTFQGGYDYAFGFEGANNYVGLAIAYGLSDSKTQGSMTDLNGSQRGVENIKSNAVEVAIYNAYVQDEGWYNDTIAKFSYIFSDFNMMGQNSTYSTNNMAFTISDEFGYRFKLGENKEWYIDPQLEVAFGYFDQSDFVQKLGVATLDGSLDNITTLRTRVGSSFGYNFKNFTKNKPVKASLYVGAFYEFDYINGGDVTMTTNLGSTNSINSLSSDGRVAINVGTNVEVYNNTRIYFDFESSFAGKIRTDYQVNIGARYSFGDSTTYSPVSEVKKDITPLKINNENKEATTSGPNTNPVENQAEQTAQ